MLDAADIPNPSGSSQQILGRRRRLSEEEYSIKRPRITQEPSGGQRV